jgi:hypothetical protein
VVLKNAPGVRRDPQAADEINMTATEGCAVD